MERSFDKLCARLAEAGLNLVGCASVAHYDNAVPPALALAPHARGARTAIVVGNGGRAFWDAFRRAGRAGGAHPLDAFTRDVVAAAARETFPGARCFWPFAEAAPRLSFLRLAACAGLGAPSLLGTLVHPEYGPWIALRAAIAVPAALAAPRPAEGFDPCPACVQRPCIAACPGAAMGGAGWNHGACAAHRRTEPGDACAVGCHARVACVLGPTHRYPPEALAFHQRASRPDAGGPRAPMAP